MEYNHQYFRVICIWYLFLNSIMFIYLKNYEILNICFFIIYLLYDVFYMITNKNQYRTDLMNHHLFALFIYLTIAPYMHKIANILILGESISLMNVWLKDTRLLIYRLVNIIFIRFPLWFYAIWYNINANYNIPIFIIHAAIYGPIFFIVYDIILIIKLKELVSYF